MATTAPNLEALRVFVSYPRGGLGHTWAEAVQSHMESLGAEVWRDEDAIREGEQDWYRRIEEGLAKADLLICIVAPDTEQSDWQKREMLRAVELRKPIVPLRIAAVGLPFYLQEKQSVEVRQDRQETLRVLTEAIWPCGARAAPMLRMWKNPWAGPKRQRRPRPFSAGASSPTSMT